MHFLRVEKLDDNPPGRETLIKKLLPLITLIDVGFDLLNNCCLCSIQALYNEYVHFKETEIPEKEVEKSHIKHLYKLLEVSEEHE